MRVLVTGHLGLHRHRARPRVPGAPATTSWGWTPTCTAACTFGDPTGLPSSRRSTRPARRDARATCDGIDAVVHLAALSNDPLGDLDPDADLRHQPPRRRSAWPVRPATPASSRFVFSSSCSNYGAAGGGAAGRDVAAATRSTPYGESKVRVERDVCAARRTTSTPCVRCATRPPTACRPRLRCDVVLNNLVAWAHHDRARCCLKSDGTPWRPIVHIERHRAGRSSLALDAPREDVHGQAFNVGATAENYQIRELAEIVAQVVPGCEVELASGRVARHPQLPRRLRPVRPDGRLPAPNGTSSVAPRSCTRPYRKVGLTLAEVEGPRFQRIAQIRRLLEEGSVGPDLRFGASAA